MAGQITLISARFGMGNNNQAHVHRHNTLTLDTMSIDTMKMEQYQGGVTGTTMNRVAAESGMLTNQPQGMVNIEDGWNQRRGIGMLKFIVEENSMVQKELSVLGYLTGSPASEEGIPGDTMFVPVRSWEVDTRSVNDNIGMPMSTSVVTASTQFLQGDPYGQNNLKSIRPLDVGNEVLGFMACEAEGTEDSYDGVMNSDLNKNIVMSKTENLNPTHHARELLKIATSVSGPGAYDAIENSIGDSMMAPSINELSMTHNAFFRTMMFVGGMHAQQIGFQGYSIAEINNVFENLVDVLNLTLLNVSSFAHVDNVLGSHEYGGANAFETIGTELAFLTVHLLLKEGLTHLEFSATNNVHDFGGLTGSEDGVEILIGPFGSVLDHDAHALQRVESFKRQLKMHFFSKYMTGYAHSTTIINVEVVCSIFGETQVQLFFNGDRSDTRNFVNATYCINRTSTNIAGSARGMAETKNFMSNINDYFRQ